LWWLLPVLQLVQQQLKAEQPRLRQASDNTPPAIGNAPPVASGNTMTSDRSVLDDDHKIRRWRRSLSCLSQVPEIIFFIYTSRVWI
jgi:hypothetical protein